MHRKVVQMNTYLSKKCSYLFLSAMIVMGLLFQPITTLASSSDIPEWHFGASERSQTMHIDERRDSSPVFSESNISAPSTQFHISQSFSQSSYSEGDFIGTIHVERLSRTVRIYEGETMHNMDFGAGRFTFSGLHSGNMGLIGHNRGPAGFFSFVRLLQYGDIITIETSQGTRRYSVEMLYIINETDFSPLQNFNDNRITLITCVEYRQTLRRVAVAIRI